MSKKRKRTETERSLLLDKRKTQFIRDRRGFQLELAKKLGVSPQHLNNWLMGSFTIKESYLVGLSNVLSVHPRSLLAKSSIKFLENLEG